MISKKTWEEIPAATRPKLVAAAKKIVDDLYKETIDLEKRAMDTMLQNGLRVHTVPADGTKLWEKEAYKGYDAYVGKTFSRELLQRLQGYVREYREKK